MHEMGQGGPGSIHSSKAALILFLKSPSMQCRLERHAADRPHLSSCSVEVGVVFVYGIHQVLANLQMGTLQTS